MKTTLIILALVALSGCAISMPPVGTIAVPVGNPPIGTASLSRVEVPAPGTRLGFATTGDTLGNDRVRWEVNEREVVVTVFDEPQPWPVD